jgi:hypothetical protein
MALLQREIGGSSNFFVKMETNSATADFTLKQRHAPNGL